MLTRSRALLLLFALGAGTWMPRLAGPIDLRWDGGVYYILGTALAEGKGYRLLNEPGEITAVQYPPMLPALIAVHQIVLGTNDAVSVGRWLRATAVAMFLLFVYVTFRFLESHLPLGYAFCTTALCILTLHVYFLSDLCFPEIPFSVCVLLFLLPDKRDGTPAGSTAAYLYALLAYAFRMVGIVALVTWVADSVFRKQFGQAAVRVLLALAPVASWQFYVASVKSSDEYNRPAYAYQRAPYLFYNVSYGDNVSLRAPFSPEEGLTSPVIIARQFVSSAWEMPAKIGETLTTERVYGLMLLQALFGEDRMFRVLTRILDATLFALGCAVVGGFVVQLARRQWNVPVFGLTYLGILCLTPFPAQYLRYLMPIAPVLFLALAVFLRESGGAAATFIAADRERMVARISWAVLLTLLLVKAGCVAQLYVREHQPISYTDRRGRQVEYRLFYYGDRERDFDRTIDFVSERAGGHEVVAAGTPHWIYLRTGLKAVMPPLEPDVAAAQDLLDSVPVTYLIVGLDVIGSERYTRPVVERFPDRWRPVYSTPARTWSVYQRVNQ